MESSSGSLNSALMIPWYQELALRTVRLPPVSPGRDHDDRRCIVLMAACRLGDVFFMNLHQLCCLWCTDRTFSHEILDPLADPGAIDFAFEELHKVLNGEQSSCCDLKWFASFPYPASRMLTSFTQRSLAMDIAQFIEKFASCWRPMLHRAEVYDRPVSGVELRDTLHCSFPLLRYILFVTSCVEIGIMTGTEATLLDDDFERGEGHVDSSGNETVRQALAAEQVRFIDRRSCRDTGP